MIFLIPVVVVIAALLLFAILPARANTAQYETFAKRFYAHRGLFDNEKDIPENSLSAFRRAAKQGYGSELDVQFTADKQLIVFHDDNYNRMCGDERNVWDVPWDEASQLRLMGTSERIPLFSETLRAVGGRQPLIVEIKTSGRSKKWNEEVCMQTLRLLREYDGPCCVESFQPHVVSWFRRHASEIVRGQLLYGKKCQPNISWVRRATYSQCLLNFIGRPHFIAMYHEDRNFGMKMSRRMGAMTMLWTVKTTKECNRYMPYEDAVIFDNCLPPPRYTL